MEGWNGMGWRGVEGMGEEARGRHERGVVGSGGLGMRRLDQVSDRAYREDSRREELGVEGWRWGKGGRGKGRRG